MDYYLSHFVADRPMRVPSPEDVFFAWMCALPQDADLRQAASREIARIDSAGRACEKLARLKRLFQQATIDIQTVRRGRRSRH